MRILLGLVKPNSGTATILGRRYRDLTDRSHLVGAALEASSFHPGQTARDHLRVRASTGRIGNARIEQVLELAELSGASEPAHLGLLPGHAAAARAGGSATRRSADPDPDPGYRLRVSPRLREEFGNGEQFYAQAGQVIELPARRADRPHREFLEWHLDEVFRAS
jgi:hypothetical protein